jgi:hypothetical protein
MTTLEFIAVLFVALCIGATIGYVIAGLLEKAASINPETTQQSARSKSGSSVGARELFTRRNCVGVGGACSLNW